MQTVLYARVSTVDQTIEHQETQARQAGFSIDRIIADHGVSGLATKLSERPEGKRLYDILRQGDVLVVRWIDRLGRNYRDVCDTVRSFMDRGIIIKTVINGMTFDGATTDPIQQAVRDALIGFMAATAQAQAEATREAQRAGIDYAKHTAQKYKGRKPTFNSEQLSLVREMLANGDGASTIAKAIGLTRQTILRIRDAPAKADTAIGRWGE